MLGKLLQNRYRIVQLLRAEGLYQVYLAQDTYLPHQPSCVVKHFSTSNYPESELTQRQLFQREVEALEKLKCDDRIPRLLAYFEEEQQFYLVQEFIVGNPLNAELLPGEKWHESRVVQMLQEVLGILECIHSSGLIHRDITPNNIIRRQQDNALVLVNFGLVKQAWTQVVTFNGKTSSSLISIPATIAIGTPGYMPAEQARGKPHPNSDIYALGIIGIQALTGVNPTQLLESEGQIIWQDQVAVSPQLQQVLDKMVRYYYKERYQTATETLEALQQIANYLHQPESKISRTQSHPIPVPTEQVQSSLTITSSKSSAPIWANKPALLIGILTGVTSVVVFIVSSYYLWQPPTSTPKQNYSINIPQKISPI